MNNMEALLDRFLTYIAVNTQSKPSVKKTPSSEGQLALASLLYKELIQLGLDDVTLDPHGYVMATLPSNVDWHVPTIGFISHMDTSPEASGKNVVPQVVEEYRGGDIALGIGDEVLSPIMFPVLNQLYGKTLITTDGKTLLGADDKAGIAEIITAIERLKVEQVAHGKIRIAFTPDEEIGRGIKGFNVEQFAAEWAYTIDGGAVGQLEYENFNAASVTVTFIGNNVHTGTAKGVMVNALSLVNRYQQLLPENETPENTEGYEGFFHLQSIKGNVERAELHYLIRDFTREGFEQRKKKMIDIAKQVGRGLPSHCYIEVALEDTYYNMYEEIIKYPHVIELAKQAIIDCNIEPIVQPIRGGTDGAQLSFKSLPCPNLFTGGYNFHSKHEFITLEGMQQAVDVIVKLAELTAKRYQSSSQK